MTVVASGPAPGVPPRWFVSRTLVDKSLSFCVWFALATASYAVAFPRTPPVFPLPYMAFIAYFSWLYFRLLVVPLWALNTLRLLEGRPQECPVDSARPTLLVLIAAYRAQGSITSVLEALKHQHYPSDCFHVYVITQAAENVDKWERYRAVQESVLKAVVDDSAVVSRSEIALKVLAAVIHDSCGDTDGVSDLPQHATAGRLLGWPSKALAKRLTTIVLSDLFRANHDGRPLESVWGALQRVGLELPASCLPAAKALVATCARRSVKTIADFARILGLPDGGTIFTDPGKPFQMGPALAVEGIGTLWNRALLSRRLEREILRWLSQIDNRVRDARRVLSAAGDLETRLRVAYDEIERTCPDVVEEAIRSCGPHFHHICRSKVGGGKPESLNTAYELLRRDGMLVATDNTYFVVIDADSLLHSSSLAVVAHEITADPERNVIRQIAPISTSNYAGNNVFVKMISCLDTIGSMGKWARSTRTLDRPDLPAGSGLVIPSTLLEFLRQTRGTPWDGTTITEDARLVISDYGLLDGVTRRTKFVPIHLLEAVPEGRSLLDVFRQYWTQRMRWASGGPDEVRQLWRQFGAPAMYSRPRPEEGFHAVSLEWPQRVGVRLRHLRLIARWTADHFWWGPGYGLAPFLWLAFAFWYITPVAFNLAGLVLVFGLPGWTVLVVFRRFEQFVPGGLSTIGLMRLYLGTLVLATFHTWPIIYTQFLYLVGRADQFRTWTTTAKPRF